MFPILYEIGPVTLHTYGLLLAVSFIAGIWVTSRNARKRDIHPDSIWNMGLVVIFAALVGSKILLLLSDFQYYSQNPREIFSLATLRSGGVYYGGLLMALLAAAWYLRKHRLPAWTIADAAAPGIALGQAIGRLGCLSAGCCYGRPAEVPWSITFTSNYAYDYVGTPLGIPIHPTQAYESLATLGLFFYLSRRLAKSHRPGQILIEYLGLYALIRFVIEFFRGDDRGFVLYGLLSTSQFVAILTLMGAAAAYCFYIRRKAAV